MSAVSIGTISYILRDRTDNTYDSKLTSREKIIKCLILKPMVKERIENLKADLAAVEVLGYTFSLPSGSNQVKETFNVKFGVNATKCERDYSDKTKWEVNFIDHIREDARACFRELFQAHWKTKECPTYNVASSFDFKRDCMDRFEEYFAGQLDDGANAARSRVQTRVQEMLDTEEYRMAKNNYYRRGAMNALQNAFLLYGDVVEEILPQAIDEYKLHTLVEF